MEIYKILDLNNLEGEEWRDVVGFEGLYAVSNLGRVKSLNYNHTKQEKILRQEKTKKGYLRVVLYKDGKMKRQFVHRLVATAFLSNKMKFPYVNHKDENPLNNCVENLEWCTNSYNQKYGNCPKKIGQKNSKKVFQYSLDGTLIGIWQSTMECARNGFNSGAVSACCLGKLKHYKNYIWSYREL